MSSNDGDDAGRAYGGGGAPSLENTSAAARCVAGAAVASRAVKAASAGNVNAAKASHFTIIRLVGWHVGRIP